MSANAFSVFVPRRICVLHLFYTAVVYFCLRKSHCLSCWTSHWTASHGVCQMWKPTEKLLENKMYGLVETRGKQCNSLSAKAVRALYFCSKARCETFHLDLKGYLLLNSCRQYEERFRHHKDRQFKIWTIFSWTVEVHTQKWTLAFCSWKLIAALLDQLFLK